MKQKKEIKLLEEVQEMDEYDYLVEQLCDEWSKSKKAVHYERFSKMESKNIIEKILIVANKEESAFSPKDKSFKELMEFQKKNCIVIRLITNIKNALAEASNTDEYFVEFDKDEWNIFRNIVFSK